MPALLLFGLIFAYFWAWEKVFRRGALEANSEGQVKLRNDHIRKFVTVASFALQTFKNRGARTATRPVHPLHQGRLPIYPSGQQRCQFRVHGLHRFKMRHHLIDDAGGRAIHPQGQ